MKTFLFSILSVTSMSETRIRTGMHQSDNVTFINDCISGRHLVAFDRACASHSRIRMQAVAIAILQVSIQFENIL